MDRREALKIIVAPALLAGCSDLGSEDAESPASRSSSTPSSDTETSSTRTEDAEETVAQSTETEESALDLSITTGNQPEPSVNSASVQAEIPNLDGTESAEVYFEFGTSLNDDANETTPTTITPPGTVTTEIADLQAGTVYEVRAVVAADGKEFVGQIQTFETETSIEFELSEPDQLGPTAATLAGEVTTFAGIGTAEVYFVYVSPTQEEPVATPVQTIESAQSISAEITNLESNTEYSTQMIVETDETKHRSEQGTLHTLLQGTSMFQYDARNSGHAFDAPGPGGDVDIAWSFEPDGTPRGTPIVVDGVVCFASEDGPLYAINQETGEEIWHDELELSEGTAPVVTENSVIDANGELQALDARNGDTMWESETYTAAWNAPTYHSDSLYVTGSEIISSFAVPGGEQEWSHDIGSNVFTTPAIADGMVLVGSDDGNVYALNAESGDVEWTFEASDKVQSSPTVQSGTVYVGDKSGMLYALSAATGETVWETELDDIIGVDGAVVYESSVYAFSGLVSVSSLDAATGETEWTTEFEDELGEGARYGSPFTIANGVIYAGSIYNKVAAFDTGSGEVQWTVELDGEGAIHSQPTVEGDSVFVTSQDGSLYKLE